MYMSRHGGGVLCIDIIVKERLKHKVHGMKYEFCLHDDKCKKREEVLNGKQYDKY